MNEPVWYRRHRDRSENFARVLEHDASTSDDAEFGDELAMVAALAELGTEPALDTAGRERILNAIKADAPAGMFDDAPAERQTPGPVPVRVMGTATRQRKRKASLLAAATAASIVALGAFGIQIAEDALPGDLLYDVKRTTESLSLDLTFSENDKALKLLEIASRRVAEMESLVERDRTDGGATADDVAVFDAVLTDFTRTATAASAGVTAYSTQSDGKDLATLHSWAAATTDQLVAIDTGVPAEAANRFATSIELVRQIEGRAAALLARMHCYSITSGRADALGVLPAETTCNPSADEAQQLDVLPRVSSEPATAAPRGTTAAQGGKTSKEGSLDAPNASDAVPSEASAPGTEPDPDEVNELPGLPKPSLPGVNQETDRSDDDGTTSETTTPRLPQLPDIGLG
ncbi:MAG: hypothetical protein GEU86_04805 [Actinophytocola sp.]|nr:hypothetical protein [Actinophytocola sp.]